MKEGLAGFNVKGNSKKGVINALISAHKLSLLIFVSQEKNDTQGMPLFIFIAIRLSF